jgi:hypothetical protein
MEAATPAPAGNRVDVGRILSETFSIYGAHAGPLLGTAAVVFLAVGLLQGLAGASGSLALVLLASVVAIVGSTLYGGFVVKLVEDVRDGRRDSSTEELLRSAAGVIGSLIGNGILKGIAVAIGLIALIVPGLILLTIWAVTGPVIVVERKGAMDAFGRSRELVKGEGFPVFGVIVVVFLIGVLISVITGAVGAAAGDAGRIVLSIVGSIIAAPITALASAVLYFDLVGGRPPAPAPDLVDAAPPTPGT